MSLLRIIKNAKSKVNHKSLISSNLLSSHLNSFPFHDSHSCSSYELTHTHTECSPYKKTSQTVTPSTVSKSEYARSQSVFLPVNRSNTPMEWTCLSPCSKCLILVVAQVGSTVVVLTRSMCSSTYVRNWPLLWTVTFTLIGPLFFIAWMGPWPFSSTSKSTLQLLPFSVSPRHALPGLAWCLLLECGSGYQRSP